MSERDEIAACWVTLERLCALSASDRRSLNEWLAADTHNEAAYDAARSMRRLEAPELVSFQGVVSNMAAARGAR